mmetsp:Transcript_1428/g.5623  ORF Transcript_1428/g.5623 Transcript_1428/m.5623 type:complete len:358 (-) Transcript_1428:28-1101(-)
MHLNADALQPGAKPGKHQSSLGLRKRGGDGWSCGRVGRRCSERLTHNGGVVSACTGTWARARRRSCVHRSSWGPWRCRLPRGWGTARGCPPGLAGEPESRRHRHHCVKHGARVLGPEPSSEALYHNPVSYGSTVKVVKRHRQGLRQDRHALGSWKRLGIQQDVPQLRRQVGRLLGVSHLVRYGGAVRFVIRLWLVRVFSIVATKGPKVDNVVHVVVRICFRRRVGCPPPLAVDNELEMVLASGKHCNVSEVVATAVHPFVIPPASEGPGHIHFRAPMSPLEHSRDAVFVNERTVLGGACSFQQIGGKPTGMLGCSGGSQPGGWARSWVGLSHSHPPPSRRKPVLVLRDPICRVMLGN